jgi:VWFA-related protein
MGNVARILCGALVLFFLFTGSGHPQQTPPASPSATAAQTPSASQTSAGDSPDSGYRSSTVLRYTTRLVVVDVIATDHKGNPVTDLKKEDFTLEEDGKGQQIDVFSFQTPAGTGPATAHVLPKLRPNIITNAPRYDVSRALTVLLLDGLNTETKNQVYARQQMVKFLEKLPVDQPIAVYALGTKLRLLQDFTSDPTVLKKAMMAMQMQSSPVLDDPSGIGGNNNPYAPGVLEQMAALPNMLQAVQQFEQDNSTMQTDLRVQLTLSSLNALARTLAGYPGRKNLIWLTESFPLGNLANVIANASSSTPTVSNARSELNNRDYSVETAHTASILTDAQVAVYPVDVGALVGNQVYSNLGNTDSNGNYLGRTASGRSPGGRRAMENELNRTGVQQLDAHSSMNDLADRTGGKAFYNRNDVENAIRATLDDGSTYYTLAYHPQNKEWNGKFRKISVKVHQSGVKLRYRLGYYALDPQAFARMEARERDLELGQALSLDFPVSTAVTFEARVFPPSEQTKNKVVVNYGIDPHAIVFESDANGQHAEVDYALAAYSKAGQPVKVEVQTLKTAFKPDVFEKIMRSYLPCQMQLQLPPGEYILRLGIRDDRTGLMGTITTSVTVPVSPQGS